jgi:flagellar biosynthesis/type III secretory pathway chaperone
MTDQILAEIADLVEAQAGVFAGLLDLAKKKREALVEGNLPGLDEIVKGEQALLWQGSRLEEKRYRLQQDLALNLGADPERMTLGQALEAAGETLEGSGEALRARFQGLQDSLGVTLRDLDRLNETNQQLLEQSLSFVNYSIQIFSQVRGQGPTYGADGRVDGGKPDPKRIVDTKA